MQRTYNHICTAKHAIYTMGGSSMYTRIMTNHLTGGPAVPLLPRVLLTRIKANPPFLLSTNKVTWLRLRYTLDILRCCRCRLALQCGHSRERSRCLLLRIRFGPRAAAVLALAAHPPVLADAATAAVCPCNGRAAARAARRGRCRRSPCRTCVTARARTCRRRRSPCTRCAPARAHRCCRRRSPRTCCAAAHAHRCRCRRTPCTGGATSRART